MVYYVVFSQYIDDPITCGDGVTVSSVPIGSTCQQEYDR